MYIIIQWYAVYAVYAVYVVYAVVMTRHRYMSTSEMCKASAYVRAGGHCDYPCHTYVCSMIMRNTKIRPIDETMKISSFSVLLQREEDALVKAEALAMKIKARAYR
jgi:hypothetical protein